MAGSRAKDIRHKVAEVQDAIERFEIQILLKGAHAARGGNCRCVPPNSLLGLSGDRSVLGKGGSHRGAGMAGSGESDGG